MHKKTFAAAGAFLGVLSCGLIDADITKVRFALPPRSYMFDAGALGLPAGNTTAVPCQTVMDCGCNPPPPLPAPNCSDPEILCAGGVCTARVTFTQTSTINLAQEEPLLADAPSFGNLQINSVTYEVKSNTLTVDSPPMDILVAPDGVTNPKDPLARKFGTVPSIPAGSMAPGMVDLEDDAASTFSAYASDLSKAFNFIVTSTIDVASGSPIPSGRIEVSVTGTLSVSL